MGQDYKIDPNYFIFVYSVSEKYLDTKATIKNNYFIGY